MQIPRISISDLGYIGPFCPMELPKHDRVPMNRTVFLCSAGPSEAITKYRPDELHTLGISGETFLGRKLV